jgi:hypothetical protein
MIEELNQGLNQFPSGFDELSSFRIGLQPVRKWLRE